MAESALLSRLADFLENPVIEVRLAEVGEVEQMHSDIDHLQKERILLESKLAQEIQRTLRYEDYLRSIGVNPRDVK